MYILLTTKYKRLQDGSMTLLNNWSTKHGSLASVKTELEKMDTDSAEFPSWLIEEDRSVRDSVSHIIELNSLESEVYHCRVIVF